MSEQKPDLVALAARAEEVEREVVAFREQVKEAREVALGSEDGSDPGSDDAVEGFDAILANLDTEFLPFGEVVRQLAALEGYRAFRRAGAVR